MRYLRTFLKLIIAFVLGALLATFVTLTAVSYYAVEHLTLATPLTPAKPASKKEADPEAVPQDTWINANILDVIRVGDQYASELNQFDELKTELSSHKSPRLCETICNGSSFDKDRMLEERTPYLRNYYRQNGAKALQDPTFQLKMRELSILSEMFPTSFRSVWRDVEQNRESQPRWPQKMAWSLRFEAAALAELPHLPEKWDELKKESDRIQSFRELIQSCQKGLRPAKELRAECEHL